MKQIYHIFITLLLVFAAVQIGSATNKYAVASGKWSATSSWSLTRGGTSGAAVPTSSDSVFVPSGYTITVDASSKTVKDLIIESGGSVVSSTTISSPYYLKLYGNLTNNGTFGGAADGLGLNFNGTTGNTLTGSGSTFYVCRMQPAIANATITIDANITLNYASVSMYANGVDGVTYVINSGKTLTLPNTSNIGIGTGTSTDGAVSMTITVNGTLTLANGGSAGIISLRTAAGKTATLNVGSTGTINLGRNLLMNGAGTHALNIAAGGTIVSNSVAQTIDISSATVSVSGTLDFGSSSTSTRAVGTMTVNSGGKLRYMDAVASSSGTINLATGSTVEYYTPATPASFQIPTALSTFSNLKISNSSGVSIGANTTVNGTLTLAGGNLNTGAYTLTFGTNGSVTRTSGWIVGAVAKPVTAAAPSVTYEIGDGSYYTPVNLTFSGITANGTVTAKSTSGDHAQILNASGINSASSVNRYWTLTNNSVVFTSYGAIFNFNSSDLDAGADYSTFVVSNYASSAWTSQNVSARTSTSTSISGATLFGDFAIGNVATSDPTLSISGTLSSFGLVVVNTTSSTEKTYTIGAANLTDTLTITPPAGVLISTTSGAEAATPITLTPASGAIATTTIYVKFAPTALGSFSATIAHTSPGATYQYVNVTGIGESTEPTQASTALTFTDIAPTSMTVSWTNGNGDNHLVIVRMGNPVSTSPVDGTSYTANSAFGGGTGVGAGYVVYSGAGNSFSLTGLTEGNIYYFGVYEYNGVSGSGTENYYTTSLSGVRGANVIQSNAVTANWSAPTTWIGGVVPGATDNVKIGSATITVDDTTATCNSISFTTSTGSKLAFASAGILNVYGDFTLYSSSSNHISSWAAGGKLRFKGSAVQTIKNLTTTATSSSSTPFYEIIVDKTGGKVTTEGSDNKLMLVTSLEIVRGTFQLNTADDIQGYDNSGSTTPTITVDANGTFDMVAGGANSIRSGTSGSAAIGKLTIAGTVSSFVTTSSLGLSVGGIDILDGGILYIPSGWSYTLGIHAGTININSGGILSISTTSNVWDAACTVNLMDGGIFRASATTTVFPATFTNNGTIQYARSTAGADQVVNDIDYKNLWISNTGCPKTLTLSTGRTVSGNLTVDAGVTFNVSGTGLTINGAITENGTVNATAPITLGSSATITGEAAGSYLKGTASTTRSLSGSSPVDVAGLGISINPNGNDLGSTSITRVSGTAGRVTVLGNAGINRKWTITPTTEPSSAVSVTLSWPSDDNNGKDITKLHVWRSDDAGITWSDIAGPLDGSSQSVTFTTDTFSDFTLSEEGSPLPVELTSFTAETSNNAVVLRWNTATERNNSGFQVERKINGSFQKIAFVQGNGTSSSPKNYSYTDAKLRDNGTYTYRLKQIDNDGAFSYSKEVEVSVKIIPAEYALKQNYPNPFNPSTTIQVALPSDSKVRLSLYNVIGQEIAVLSNSVLEAGVHSFTWNAANMPSGLYYYTIDASSINSKQSFKETKKMLLVK